jgi:hypothetical protein
MHIFNVDGCLGDNALHFLSNCPKIGPLVHQWGIRHKIAIVDIDSNY